ncbi:hypothetical protein QOL99_09420 [Deinococcus sp. MIMF12]|uniref:AbrB/MazE/SpoVT family DNA-binding domain-containing protein n=1 Tax=Deinococcus rhizophilus TaxID=3049544 RepID=A0ABT7JIF8_9DEIO|nr:hypothetical protein [Deinococcus rhizophilus]MDL2344372.1 hypothetical protein [Deinococcus rhizophilus]
MTDEIRRPLLNIPGDEAGRGLRVDVMTDGRVRVRVLPTGPDLWAGTLEEAAALAGMLPGVSPAALKQLAWELDLMAMRGENG